MQAQYGDQVTFIGVAGRDDADAMELFVESYGVGAFPHAIDPGNGDIWASYGVRTQPSFAFVNDDGSITTQAGSMGTGGLTAAVEDLIAT